MRSRWIVLFLALFSSAYAMGVENATYHSKPNWITRHLDRGGAISDVTGLVRGDWKHGAVFLDLKTDGPLPAAFDWRDQVAGGLQPIKNQGSCGSCWAFSISAVVESLMKIKDATSTPALSEQTLVDCSDYDCNGGDFDAFNYIQNSGLESRADYPYTARNGRCKVADAHAKQKVKSWAYVGSATTPPTTDQIKAAIMQYGPVAVDISASGGFMGYSSGIYNGCTQGQINHMTNIVGWNDDGQYWIMRNSWGADWGENGYMRIKYTDSRGNKCNRIGDTTAVAILE